MISIRTHRLTADRVFVQEMQSRIIDQQRIGPYSGRKLAGSHFNSSFLPYKSFQVPSRLSRRRFGNPAMECVKAHEKATKMPAGQTAVRLPGLECAVCSYAHWQAFSLSPRYIHAVQGPGLCLQQCVAGSRKYENVLRRVHALAKAAGACHLLTLSSHSTDALDHIDLLVQKVETIHAGLNRLKPTPSALPAKIPSCKIMNFPYLSIRTVEEAVRIHVTTDLCPCENDEP